MSETTEAGATICGTCPVCSGNIVEKTQWTLDASPFMPSTTSSSTLTGSTTSTTSTMTTTPVTSTTTIGGTTATSGSTSYGGIYSTPVQTWTGTYTSYWPSQYYCDDCGIKFENLPKAKYK